MKRVVLKLTTDEYESVKKDALVNRRSIPAHLLCIIFGSSGVSEVSKHYTDDTLDDDTDGIDFD